MEKTYSALFWFWIFRELHAIHSIELQIFYNRQRNRHIRGMAKQIKQDAYSGVYSACKQRNTVPVRDQERLY